MTNMDCPTEEALIRKRLGKVEGIERLDFDLMNRRLEVQYRLPNPLRHACHGRTRGRGLICPMKRPPSFSAPRE
ncbi:MULTISPECIES: heavy-metal-associated domain-containing protein [Burkholderiaceae]|uniref:heavy-metal-associated domain-containing protein n=1 Tax=Burkholderiaceae TaxID=119060 RepID=UPI0030133ACD